MQLGPIASFALLVLSAAMPAAIPATLPATAPAPIPAEASPAETAEMFRVWQTYSESTLKDDAAAVKACIYIPNADAGKAVESFISWSLARRSLVKEAQGWLGAEGEELLPDPLLTDADIRWRLEHIREGMHAQVLGDWGMLSGRATAPTYHHTADGWKLDFGLTIEMFGKTAMEQTASLERKTTALKKFTAAMQRRQFLDLQDAKAGFVMTVHASEHAAETRPASAPDDRWTTRAAKPGLSATEQFAFQRIAELRNAKLMQCSIPGWWDIETPDRSATDAAGELYRMGLDAVPALAEALDDTTLTPTVAWHGSGRTIPANVNDIVAQILQRSCSHTFTVGEGDHECTVNTVGKDTELAAKFRVEVLAWYKQNRHLSRNERVIGDLADKYFRNRTDAAEYLGEHHIAAAGPELEKYLVRTLKQIEKSPNSLLYAELAECGRAIGQVGDTNAIDLLKQAYAKRSQGYLKNAEEENMLFGALQMLGVEK